jgi:NADPH-dependent 2,4-dienoyl-CoA reductase/sulfur reductase-like enzyme
MQSRDESLITDADRYGKDLKGAATLRLGCRVRALETQQKYVLLEGDERVDFDVLVLATGAEPKRSRWPESDLPNVHVLRTLEDADAIIESSKGGRQVARALFRSRDGVRTVLRVERQARSALRITLRVSSLPRAAISGCGSEFVMQLPAGASP